jgi:hypothetical protein
LSGIPKAILLVVIDMAVYQTPMTLVQALGFSIAGAGTYHYSQISQRVKLDTPIRAEKKDDMLFRGDEESQLVD